MRGAPGPVVGGADTRSTYTCLCGCKYEGFRACWRGEMGGGIPTLIDAGMREGGIQ